MSGDEWKEKVLIPVKRSKDSLYFELVSQKKVETSNSIDYENVVDHYAEDENGVARPIMRKEYYRK